MLEERRKMTLVCLWVIATAILKWQDGSSSQGEFDMKWFPVVPLLIAITGLGALASVAKAQSTTRIG